MDSLERDAHSALVKHYGAGKRAGLGLAARDCEPDDAPSFNVGACVVRRVWTGATRTTWTFDGHRIARADLLKRLEAGR